MSRLLHTRITFTEDRGFHAIDPDSWEDFDPDPNKKPYDYYAERKRLDAEVAAARARRQAEREAEAAKWAAARASQEIKVDQSVAGGGEKDEGGKPSASETPDGDAEQMKDEGGEPSVCETSGEKEPQMKVEPAVAGQTPWNPGATGSPAPNEPAGSTVSNAPKVDPFNAPKPKVTLPSPHVMQKRYMRFR